MMSQQDTAPARASHSTVYKTRNGTPYLKQPGTVLVGWTESDVSGLGPFLQGLGGDEYERYVGDDWGSLSGGEGLAKFAGQLCYASFGDARTPNSEAAKYFQNVKEQRHGTLFGHPYATIFAYGISRSCTHELVRHKVAWEFSQLSQRYVGPEALRFVERPEFVGDPVLHKMFEYRIDAARDMYNDLIQKLIEAQAKAEGDQSILFGEKRRDRRKKVQQTARCCLPNETETFLVMTANVRAWRVFLELRASEHAETEIRRLAMRCYDLLVEVWPNLLSDYSVTDLDDGTQGLRTPFTKV